MDELTIDELLKLPIKYLNGYLTDLDTYELLYDTRFIKLISTIKDVECYRSIMNKLTKYIDTSIIEKLRLNYYNKIINTFNPNTQTFFFYTNLLDAIRNNKEDIIISYFEDLEHHNLYEIVNNIQYIIKSNLTKEETITIDFDGGRLDITPDMVDVRIDAKEGFNVGMVNNKFIILNTELTRDLLLEGLAREAVSKIQNLRKTTGLEISDRIKLYYNGDDEIKETFNMFKKYIMDETLSIVFEETNNNLDIIDINGHNVGIKIEKA